MKLYYVYQPGTTKSAFLHVNKIHDEDLKSLDFNIKNTFFSTISITLVDERKKQIWYACPNTKKETQNPTLYNNPIVRIYHVVKKQRMFGDMETIMDFIENNTQYFDYIEMTGITRQIKSFDDLLGLLKINSEIPFIENSN